MAVGVEVAAETVGIDVVTGEVVGRWRGGGGIGRTTVFVDGSGTGISLWRRGISSITVVGGGGVSRKMIGRGIVVVRGTSDNYVAEALSLESVVVSGFLALLEMIS